MGKETIDDKTIYAFIHNFGEENWKRLLGKRVLLLATSGVNVKIAKEIRKKVDGSVDFLYIDNKERVSDNPSTYIRNIQDADLCILVADNKTLDSEELVSKVIHKAIKTPSGYSQAGGLPGTSAVQSDSTLADKIVVLQTSLTLEGSVAKSSAKKISFSSGANEFLKAVESVIANK